MGTVGRKLKLRWIAIVLCCFLLSDYTAKIHALWGPTCKAADSTPVTINISDGHVELDNGLVKLTLLNPSGEITGVEYNGINALDQHQLENRRGYLDMMWSRPDIGGPANFDTIESTGVKVIAQNQDLVEVSFIRTWDASLGNNGVPLNIDKRFVMLRGVSGFYSYAVFEHMAGWPAVNVDEARIAFKLDKDLFTFMAISDDKQRIMPTASDRETGEVLQYKEAVRLTNPSNPELKGEVDDKYQYSLENKDSHVHGWISSNPHVGFWVITPSDEFRAGGPIKLDLTSHVGPTSLALFFSGHYAGPQFGVKLSNGEPWKKVFGPVFIYLNSDTSKEPSTLWNDAKRQMYEETKKWPYNFPASPDFPHADQRGSITGHLVVSDRSISSKYIPAKSAYVGLASPGDIGSWQTECKGYQFWVRADKNGYFTIAGIRPGTYNLYAWVPGFIGDFKHTSDIVIKPGKRVKVGNLVYYPPRNGPTIWEIGIPDRYAAEFYIPDPAPDLVNKLYVSSQDKYRQYGLWDRYTDLYPNQDPIFTVGASDYRKDWFFAHVNRRVGNTYTPTTRQIAFDLPEVKSNGNYTLRLAMASSSYTALQVWINDPNGRNALMTGRFGFDNAIARHGIHGQYSLFSYDFSGSMFVSGRNTIYLKQREGEGPFNGFLYDYIRLEGPRGA